MKRILMAVAAMFAAVSMWAQGQVNFNNNTAPKTPWMAPYPHCGSLLGDDYQVQLWVGTSAGSLAPVAALPARFKMSGGAPTGIFLGGITDVGVAWGMTIYYEAKVFPVGYSSCDAALAAGQTVAMTSIKSMVVVAPPSGPAVTLFDKPLVCWPEPGPVALMAVGLGLLILRRRS